MKTAIIGNFFKIMEARKIKIKILCMFLLVNFLIVAPLSTAVLASELGEFRGRLVLEEVSDGNSAAFKLVEDFTFVDSGARIWTAPRGTIVNGASIPKYFWSIIGGPWSGHYRRASVIHDHFCQTRSRSWIDVHRVFYEAMIASGVSEIKAKLMYFAVYRYGPRWTNTERNLEICSLNYIKSGEYISVSQVIKAGYCDRPSEVQAYMYWQPELRQDAAIKAQMRWIREENPSLMKIRKLADTEIVLEAPYRDFIAHLSRWLRRINVDPLSDGRMAGLIELGLVK